MQLEENQEIQEEKVEEKMPQKLETLISHRRDCADAACLALIAGDLDQAKRQAREWKSTQDKIDRMILSVDYPASQG